MGKKQSLSQQVKRSLSLKFDYLDPCPACDRNLYHDDYFTKRVALLEKDKVRGWQCPFCDCQFDLKDNVTYINTSDNRAGKS